MSGEIKRLSYCFMELQELLERMSHCLPQRLAKGQHSQSLFLEEFTKRNDCIGELIS